MGRSSPLPPKLELFVPLAGYILKHRPTCTIHIFGFLKSFRVNRKPSQDWLHLLRRSMELQRALGWFGEPWCIARFAHVVMSDVSSEGPRRRTFRNCFENTGLSTSPVEEGDMPCTSTGRQRQCWCLTVSDRSSGRFEFGYFKTLTTWCSLPQAVESSNHTKTKACTHDKAIARENTPKSEHSFSVR